MRRLLVPLAMLLAVRGALAAERPNIVFFLVDDLGSHDCGFMGGTECKTPHIDKLASQGTILDQFYVQCVCSPTRGALMTGRYPAHLGIQVGVIRPWAKYGLPLEERTLPQALREAGYTTGIFGKWHLGSFDQAYWPNARGFDHAYGHYFGAIDCFTHIRDGIPDWHRNSQPVQEEGYSTHLLAKEAVGWVKQQSAEKPFFLYFPFNAVHTPLQVPDSYLEPYGSLSGQRKIVAGMLAAVDEAIGQVVAEVEARGLRKNTLFIFSSDNGGFAPGKATDNTPLRAGKGTLYEGGVRSTAFITWDGHVPAGKHNAQPMHLVDWYPTLLTLAGGSLQQPQPLDGRDVWGTLTAGKPSPHDEIVLHCAPTKGALRMGDWKIVINPLQSEDVGEGLAETKQANAKAPAKGKKTQGNEDRVELYNLAADPTETTDLAAREPKKLAELKARYDAIAATQRRPLQEDFPSGRTGKGGD